MFLFLLGFNVGTTKLKLGRSSLIIGHWHKAVAGCGTTAKTHGSKYKSQMLMWTEYKNASQRKNRTLFQIDGTGPIVDSAVESGQLIIPL